MNTFVKPGLEPGSPRYASNPGFAKTDADWLMSTSKERWYKQRRYLHLDAPISYQKARDLVTNPEVVARHAFLPLINYEITSSKISLQSDGKLESGKTKIRSISYASHADAQIYSFYSHLLSESYEAEIARCDLDDSILAFRSLNKSNIDFANDAFEEIKRRGECAVIALDISGFFDNLDHAYLKSSWANLLGEPRLPEDHFAVYQSLTRFSKVSRDQVYSKFGVSRNNPKQGGRYRICSAREFRDRIRQGGLISVNKNNYGIPQGTPISALLSNIYMLKFDSDVKAAVDEMGGSYYRYCDDMLFIVPSEFQDEVEGFAASEISKLKLRINREKTEIRNFFFRRSMLTCDKPLQYLGFTFDGQRKLIRSAAFARFSNRMKRGVRLAKQTKNRQNKIELRRGAPSSPIFKKKLYSRYSYRGSRNFVTYGHRAATTMKSKAIKKQLKPLWGRLQDEIDK